MGKRIYYLEMPELPTRSEKYDKAAEYITQFVIGKLKRARFPFIDRAAYIELCENSDDEDFIDSTLLSIWGRQALLHLNGYTSFNLKVKNFEYVTNVFVEIGTISGEFADGYNISCSGSITTSIPHRIQINILIPSKYFDNKNWSPIIEQEVFLEIVGTIRHEIQHSIQYTRFTSEQKEANQVMLTALDLLGKDKMNSLWNYDKIYFSQKMELEAYIKEFQLVAKYKNGTFDEVLIDFLKDHIFFIGNQVFNAFSIIQLLMMSSIPRKMKKSDKIKLAEILKIYDSIINQFYSFKERYGRKISFVKKRRK